MLIVDDNCDLCRNLADILEDRGIVVRMEHDGEKAVAAVAMEDFDLVLMDIRMPTMDGVEAYRKIKEAKPSTPVIMMTAFTTDDLVRDALREGVHAVLYKPLDVEVLLTTVESSRDVGRMILVVDDDTDMCHNLQDILRAQGYRVSCAHTAEEAILAAQANNADIYLIDLKLPTRNGLETYLAVKDIRPNAVALIITAYADELPHLVDSALQYGAYACLRKPVDIAILTDVVDQALRSRGVVAE